MFDLACMGLHGACMTLVSGLHPGLQYSNLVHGVLASCLHDASPGSTGISRVCIVFAWGLHAHASPMQARGAAPRVRLLFANLFANKFANVREQVREYYVR